jgi:AcrR family transcriptional regulator
MPTPSVTACKVTDVTATGNGSLAHGSRRSTSGGRPRDPAIDAAVLAATREVLLEVGYPRLGFELVAKRAGVTRPTIYRRWSSKMHLVHDAVFPHRGPVELPDTGSLAADLRELVRRGFDAYARPEVRAALPGLMADLHEDEALRHDVLDRLDQQARDAFAQLVTRAVDRGEIPPIDAEPVFDVLYGALFGRVVARGDLAPEFADVLADLLMRGLSAAN